MNPLTREERRKPKFAFITKSGRKLMTEEFENEEEWTGAFLKEPPECNWFYEGNPINHEELIAIEV